MDSKDDADKPGFKARDFCITSYDENPPCFDVDSMHYLVYQQEICPTTRTRHWQGYVEFKTQRSTRKASQLLGLDKKWLSARRGTREQARDYCLKNDTREGNSIPKEFGQWRDNPTDGKGGGNLSAIIMRIRNGGTLRNIANEYPNEFIRYSKGIKEYYYETRQDKEWFTPFWVLHGSSGVGKTEYIYKTFGKSNCFFKAKGRWFDGYRGQPIVVIDEWEKDEEFTYKNILELFDARPIKVPIKGGFDSFRAKLIVFSSTKHYKEIFNLFPQYDDKGNDVTYKEFERRIDFYKDTWEDMELIINNYQPREKIIPENLPSLIPEIYKEQEILECLEELEQGNRIDEWENFFADAERLENIHRERDYNIQRQQHDIIDLSQEDIVQ